MTDDELNQLIQDDTDMMRILCAAETLQLPDWWIGAGFLRNKIWDHLSGKSSTPARDIDLVYFDAKSATPERDWEYDKQMKKDFPFAEWEIRNQARMHYVNQFEPFTSTADGIAHWVETATCVAVRIESGELKYLFCYGTEDLFAMVARPTPYFEDQPLLQRFYDRVEQKQWQTRWPRLIVK